MTGNALFGGTAALAPMQPALGRKLAIFRVYYHVGGGFPTQADQGRLARGSDLVVSLDLRRHQTYPQVTAGKLDGKILNFYRSVNTAAAGAGLGTIYVDFEHEPSTQKNTIHGTAPEFVAAWQHVWLLVHHAGLDWQNGGRLRWVWIMVHDSFKVNKDPGTWGYGSAPQFWPGRGYVDILGVDGYNHPGCHTHSPPGSTVFSPATIFRPALVFARSHGYKRVYITEFGSISYPSYPDLRPEWIDSMTTYITNHSAIIAADYWDEPPRRRSNCSFQVNNDPASLAALARMGKVLTGSVTPPATAKTAQTLAATRPASPSATQPACPGGGGSCPAMLRWRSGLAGRWPAREVDCGCLTCPDAGIHGLSSNTISSRPPSCSRGTPSGLRQAWRR